MYSPRYVLPLANVSAPVPLYTALRHCPYSPEPHQVHLISILPQVSTGVKI